MHPVGECGFTPPNEQVAADLPREAANAAEVYARLGQDIALPSGR
jgi:hypothetical protein